MARKILNNGKHDKCFYDDEIINSVLSCYGEDSEIYKAMMNGQEISGMIEEVMENIFSEKHLADFDKKDRVLFGKQIILRDACQEKEIVKKAKENYVDVVCLILDSYGADSAIFKALEKGRKVSGMFRDSIKNRQGTIKTLQESIERHQEILKNEMKLLKMCEEAEESEEEKNQ